MIEEVISFCKEVVSLVKQLLTQNTAARLQKVRDIYGEMTQLVENYPVERFLILKVENGGGILKPGSHLYASLIYEMYRWPIRSTMVQYQRILVDSEYLNVILQSIEKQGIKVHIDDLASGTILRSIYEGQGIKYAELYPVLSTKKAVYFASVSTTQPNQEFDDPKVRLAIMLAINKIKLLIK